MPVPTTPEGADELSELRRENALLKARLAESQRLYDEICHRIRNELQAFSMLFAAQLKRYDHPEHCKFCLTRIYAGAALHVALDPTDCETCRLSEFISALAKSLHAAFDDRFENIVNVEDHIEIDPLRAKRVGLILVEAMTNAINHGLAGLDKGKIETRLRRFGNQIELVVENDGAPYKPDARPGQGLKIMRDLAEELSGTIELVPRSPGASLRLTFPITPAQGDNRKLAEAALSVP